jgi:hypothetical protein
MWRSIERALEKTKRNMWARRHLPQEAAGFAYGPLIATWKTAVTK